MDSTQPQPQPQPQPQSQLVKPSASKLPIKRKTPLSQHPEFYTPKLEYQPIIFHPLEPKPKPPALKYHRIWTEADEISFLQGLLHSHSLSFPKDLPIFYSSFSTSISQPYTKSQLSEKLRRLRKKFRVISSRLARGLNPSTLSPHDQALFHLSKRLWSPEFASTSPFGKNNNSSATAFILENNGIDGNYFDDCDMIDNDWEVKINEVNLNSDFGESVNEGSINGVLAKSVLGVFDECFKEARMVFAKQSVVWMDAMDMKWKEQSVSELDVLGRRLRLVIENSLTRR